MCRKAMPDYYTLLYVNLIHPPSVTKRAVGVRRTRAGDLELGYFVAYRPRWASEYSRTKRNALDDTYKTSNHVNTFENYLRNKDFSHFKLIWQQFLQLRPEFGA